MPDPSLKSPLISVIVPCYNEEEVLPVLIREIERAAQGWGGDWEVVCVDDGSDDGTWRLLCEQAQRDPRWRGVSFSRNFGHQAAMAAGLRECRGHAAVIIDADLQDPPAEIARFIAAWRAGSEVVYGVRETRSDAALKRFLAWAFYRVLRPLLRFDLPADAGEFALLDRRVVDAMNQLSERERFVRGLRAWSGFRQTAIAFKRAPRAAGRPKYHVRKSLGLAIDGIVSFSIVPLRWISYTGMLAMVAALMLGGWALFRFAAAEPSIATNASGGLDSLLLASAMIFLAGVQLLGLGLVATYLGRMSDDLKGRPGWVIRSRTEPAIAS